MNRSYYYFLASLPLLDLDKPLPLSPEKFREDCQRLLAPEDLHEIDCVLEDRLGEGRHFLTKRLARAAEVYGQELGRRRRRLYEHRAQELHGEEFSPYPRLQELLRRADQEPDPLAGETLIARVMWHYLDELTVGHAFGMDDLLVYAFRLKIAARFEVLRSGRGREVRDALIEKSLDALSQQA